MNRRQPAILSCCVLLLVGATALLLGRMQAAYRLGEPGLRLTREPLLSDDGKPIGTNSVELPGQVLDFKSQLGTVSALELGYLPADTTYGRRFYAAPDGFRLMVSVVLMGQDRTSIHKPQYCLVGQGWTIERTDQLEVEVKQPDGSPARLPVMRLIAARPVRNASGATTLMKAVYVYWFVADGRVTARHGERMWWMARDLLTQGVLQRWAYVSCLAVGQPGSEDAMYRRIETFIASAVPEFQHPDTFPPAAIP